MSGAEIDAIGGDLLSTPLHWATRQGLLDMVVLLMLRGGDPKVMDGPGQTCLHIACQMGQTAIAAYFISKGCHVDLPDKNGMTPLGWYYY